MNVLFCSLNASYVHASLAPWCLMAGVKQYCAAPVRCDVLEATVNQPEHEVLAELCEKSPDVAAFSCYIWNIEAVRRLAAGLREMLPDTIIVLGGPEVSFDCAEVLQSLPAADFLIAGEGERPMALLLEHLAAGRHFDEVPGLYYRKDGKVTGSPAAAPAGEPPSPYSPLYFKRLGGRMAYLETSRGCPFSCSFCLSGIHQGARFYGLERAKREILLLAGSGARVIKLVDRTFNCNPGRAYELWSFILSEYGNSIPYGTRFHFEVGADLFDERTLRLLQSAPPALFQLEAGLQSFHPETLAAVQRKTDLTKLCENLRALMAPGNLHVHIDLIAGLPYEGMESFARSFNLAYALGPHMLQLGFLKLLRGSRLREQAAGYGIRFSPQPPYEFYETKWLSREDISLLHRAEDALERLYNSGRFPRTLRYILATTGLEPFALFCEVGDALAEKLRPGASLDDYTAAVFAYFCSLQGIDRGVLRDEMACDRLSCDNTGRLPPCLRVFDPRLKELARRFGPHCFAMLYSGGERVAVADYTRKDPITHRYPVQIHALQPGPAGDAPGKQMSF